MKVILGEPKEYRDGKAVWIYKGFENRTGTVLGDGDGCRIVSDSECFTDLMFRIEKELPCERDIISGLLFMRRAFGEPKYGEEECMNEWDCQTDDGRKFTVRCSMVWIDQCGRFTVRGEDRLHTREAWEFVADRLQTAETCCLIERAGSDRRAITDDVITESYFGYLEKTYGEARELGDGTFGWEIQTGDGTHYTIKKN